MNLRHYWFPSVVGMLGVLYLAWVLSNRPHYADDQFDFTEVGALPVVHQGRVKPLDTVARANLPLISGKQTYKDDDGVRHSATEWMVEVMADGRAGSRAAAAKLFRIDNDQVLTLLGLRDRPGFRYSLDECRDRMPAAQKQLQRLKDPDAKRDPLYDAHLKKFGDRWNLYFTIAVHDAPLVIPPSHTMNK